MLYSYVRFHISALLFSATSAFALSIVWGGATASSMVLLLVLLCAGIFSCISARSDKMSPDEKTQLINRCTSWGFQALLAATAMLLLTCLVHFGLLPWMAGPYVQYLLLIATIFLFTLALSYLLSPPSPPRDGNLCWCLLLNLADRIVLGAHANMTFIMAPHQVFPAMQRLQTPQENQASSIPSENKVLPDEEDQKLSQKVETFLKEAGAEVRKKYEKLRCVITFKIITKIDDLFLLTPDAENKHPCSRTALKQWVRNRPVNPITRRSLTYDEVSKGPEPLHKIINCGILIRALKRDLNKEAQLSNGSNRATLGC